MAEREPFDIVAAIMRYEDDSMSNAEVITFFQYLVDSGEAWALQGHYGRMAHSLIAAGLVKPKE